MQAEDSQSNQALGRILPHPKSCWASILYSLPPNINWSVEWVIAISNAARGAVWPDDTVVPSISPEPTFAALGAVLSSRIVRNALSLSDLAAFEAGPISLFEYLEV